MENFQISGTTISAYPELRRRAGVGQAGRGRGQRRARACCPRRSSHAIVAACEEIRKGELHDQFVVDMIQGGAGTSTNMNANEVIANRALEILGHAQGEYQHLHPNEHVNMAQSTNDVYPTALQARDLLRHRSPARGHGQMLRGAFRREGDRVRTDVLKMGRTQLQDAVPMTLGQEFSTYAVMLDEDDGAAARGLVC